MEICGAIEFKMDKKSYRMIPLAKSEDYLYNRQSLKRARQVHVGLKTKTCLISADGVCKSPLYLASISISVCVSAYHPILSSVVLYQRYKN